MSTNSIELILDALITLDITADTLLDRITEELARGDKATARKEGPR